MRYPVCMNTHHPNRALSQKEMEARRLKAVPHFKRKLSERRIAEKLDVSGPSVHAWKVAWQKRGVAYEDRSVWHLLKRLGFSCQKPLKRAVERDEKAITTWIQHTWPEAKKGLQKWRDIWFLRRVRVLRPSACGTHLGIEGSNASHSLARRVEENHCRWHGHAQYAHEARGCRQYLLLHVRTNAPEGVPIPKEKVGQLVILARVSQGIGAPHC